jgi:predicted ATPase
VLKNGGLAFIDEFESGLHPHLIRELVHLFLFYSRRTNQHHAQLVFTSHADYLLTDLEKYQIVLVEKADKCISHAWRLDEMKGIRSDDNIHAKYHAGAYSAVPDL